MTGSTRRSALKRGLVLLAGALGLGAAGESAATARGPGATSLILYARNLHSHSRDLRAGARPEKGERLTTYAELLDAPRGRRVGELYAAGFALHGPGGPADAERLELQTFKLSDGTIVGTGAGGSREGVFAVVGGTGRYAGAKGTYVARQSRHELGGDGAAEFAFTLVL